MSMKIGYIFYAIGTIFLIAALLYFTWEYILNLARFMKAIVIFLLAVMFYFFSVWLNGRNM